MNAPAACGVLIRSIPWIATLVFFFLVIPSPAKGEDEFAGGFHVGIESRVRQAIERGDLPGAVVCLADSKHIRYLKAFGDRDVEPANVVLRTDTIFDLASITKPVATASSVMLLQQQGKLAVEDPVVKYLPEFGSEGKEAITIRHCLLHTSGLTPDNSLRDYDHGAEEAWRRICALPLRSKPGERFAYSDVGFIVLGKVVGRVAGMSLDRFAEDNIFKPLGMSETVFNPGRSLRVRAAPTEKREGDWIRGEVHDPRSFRLDGVAGHAGLFSSAHDLVRFGQSLLAASRGRGAVFERSAFERMTRPHDIGRGTRTLGWDHRSPYSRNRGSALSESAFGHGGFTGTVFWIDPEKDLIFVFLSSRLHPDGKGSVNTLAGEILTHVGEHWQPSQH
jgi:CubicO group peptidase (beta-lactamase class C family)